MDLMRSLRLALWFAGFAATTAGSYYAMGSLDFTPTEDPHGYSRTSNAFELKEAYGSIEEARERAEVAGATGDYSSYGEVSTYD